MPRASLTRPRPGSPARRAFWLLAAFAAAYVLCAAAIALSGLRDHPGHADLAVVLGNEVLPNGQPSARLAARCERAAQLYREGGCTAVLTSGGVENNGFDEAAVMADYLAAHGVPAACILQDNQGINTYATARNTRRILREHGWQSVCVVTQYFHVPRSRYALWRFGVRPVYAVHARYFEWLDFFATGREAAGFGKYLLRRYPPEPAEPIPARPDLTVRRQPQTVPNAQDRSNPTKHPIMAQSELDGTISALSGGLTALSPTAAVSNIESWESQLKATDKPELHSIATDLAELRQKLTSGHLDGAAIGKLLTKLGHATTATAAGAAAGAKDKLATLGSVLTKAGGALGGH